MCQLILLQIVASSVNGGGGGGGGGTIGKKGGIGNVQHFPTFADVLQ